MRGRDGFGREVQVSLMGTGEAAVKFRMQMWSRVVEGADGNAEIAGRWKLELSGSWETSQRSGVVVDKMTALGWELRAAQSPSRSGGGGCMRQAGCLG